MEKPTVEELGGLPEGWSTREEITVERLVRRVDEVDRSSKSRVARSFGTKSYRSIFRRALKNAKDNGYIVSDGYGEPLRVTEKGRKKVFK